MRPADGVHPARPVGVHLGTSPGPAQVGRLADDLAGRVARAGGGRQLVRALIVAAAYKAEIAKAVEVRRRAEAAEKEVRKAAAAS